MINPTYKCLILLTFGLWSCKNSESSEGVSTPPESQQIKIELDRAQASALAQLPLDCIDQPLPYKSGLVIATAEDLAMPIEHHPAFYGCFDWHSAVHGHWSLVYLLKNFPDLDKREEIIAKLDKNLTRQNIEKEVAYFSLNKQSKSFERTYGWAWLLKLSEELHDWDTEEGRKWYTNLRPLADHISQAYQTFLPKLVYPIRVGEHTNTAFGLSFAHDYAMAIGDEPLKLSIEEAAKRFYLTDRDCPVEWEPSGFDFLSPCLQEVDIMRKVLPDAKFKTWFEGFMPGLADTESGLTPAEVKDRSDGKLVHLDGLNYSRAWCLYSLKGCDACTRVADEHLAFSLGKIADGEYAGQHWLASFALYAFKAKRSQN